MTIDEILQALCERDAVLYIEAGRLKYRGPKRAPDDPIRAAIDTRRADLIELFTPRPAIWPTTSSDSPTVDIPEPESLATACVFCPAPLAESDPIACVACRERLSVTPFTLQPSVAVTLGPVDAGLSVTSDTLNDTVAVTSVSAMSPADLLAIAELRGWEVLPFRPGESTGGSEAAWRTFTGWARGETLRQASEAVLRLWWPTVEQDAQGGAMAAPENPEAEGRTDCAPGTS